MTSKIFRELILSGLSIEVRSVKLEVFERLMSSLQRLNGGPEPVAPAEKMDCRQAGPHFSLPEGETEPAPGPLRLDR